LPRRILPYLKQAPEEIEKRDHPEDSIVRGDNG